MKQLTIIIIALLLLAGCAQKLAAADNSTCLNKGAPGTPAYQQCRAALTKERAAKADLFARTVAGYQTTVCHQMPKADGSVVTVCGAPRAEDVDWWR
jgi:hypothetical protein